jgi:hypothetical protein
VPQGCAPLTASTGACLQPQHSDQVLELMLRCPQLLQGSMQSHSTAAALTPAAEGAPMRRMR